jgi:hypothetical protein
MVRSRVQEACQLIASSSRACARPPRAHGSPTRAHARPTRALVAAVTPLGSVRALRIAAIAATTVTRCSGRRAGMWQPDSRKKRAWACAGAALC